MIKANMEEKDELDEIFVDKNVPPDKKILAEILKPFVTIDVEGIISFSKAYSDLDDSKKVLVYLLCKKAMVLKGINDTIEPTRESETVQKAMVSKSTAKNAIYTLYKEIVKKEREGYVIPNYNLNKVKMLIFETTKKNHKN